MSINLNKKTSLGPEGYLIARNNPGDGTPISPTRILGFSGTVDLSAYVAGGDNAYLGIKIDNGAEDVRLVDWTPAVNKAAVTVAEMITAITAAAFVNITASADPITGRLMIACTVPGTIVFLQVFSVSTHPNFAAELDFGQGQTYGGFGAMYLECFDNTKSVSTPNEIKDKEVIETEDGGGTLISVTLPAIIKGKNPVYTMTDNDLRLKYMIMGGTWDPLTSEYKPPLSSQTTYPIFSTWIFSPLYGKGSNKKENFAGFLQFKMESQTGIEADTTLETKALQERAFNCTATEWENSAGTKQPFYSEKNLSETEFNNLHVEEIEPVTDYTT